MEGSSTSSRVGSAAAASVLSALVVTPLDVVKTRMQMQAAGGSTASRGRQLCQGATIPVRSAGGNVKNLPFRDIALGLWHYGSFTRGGTASCPACTPALSSLAFSPHASDWCHASQPVTSSSRPSMLSTFKTIIRMEGVKALWKGLDTAMLLSIPMVGIYMPMYDHLHASFKGDLGAYAPAVAGMAARGVAVLATAPLELSRTRQQAGPAASTTSTTGRPSMSSQSHLSSSLQLFTSPASRQLILPQIRSMWTGVGATLARDVPFTALYWCAVEPIRWYLLSPENGTGLAGGAMAGSSPEDAAVNSSWRGCSSDVAPSTTRVMWANLAAGSVSGALAAVATTPFDVVKTRLQTSAGASSAPRSQGHGYHTQPGCIGAGTTHHARIAGVQRPTGTVGMLRSIWQTEGMRGLFAGVGPRAARSAPACAIVIATYEVLKTVL